MSPKPAEESYSKVQVCSPFNPRWSRDCQTWSKTFITCLYRKIIIQALPSSSDIFPKAYPTPLFHVFKDSGRELHSNWYLSWYLKLLKIYGNWLFLLMAFEFTQVFFCKLFQALNANRSARIQQITLTHPLGWVLLLLERKNGMERI